MAHKPPKKHPRGRAWARAVKFKSCRRRGKGAPPGAEQVLATVHVPSHLVLVPWLAIGGSFKMPPRQALTNPGATMKINQVF